MKKLLSVLFFLLIVPYTIFSQQTWDAIVLYDRVNVKFFSDGRKVWREERAVKVLTRKGIKEKGEVVIPFSTEHEKLKILYAYTLLPDGRKIKPSKEAFNIVSPPFESKAPIYSDLKYRTISMPGLKPGATIVYGFELKTVKPYMKGEFWAVNFMQERYPLKEALFTAEIPQNRKVKIKSYNIEKKPTVKRKKGFIIYTWKLENVPPIKREPSMPPMDEIAKKVAITSIDSWNKVATWYSDLSKDALKPDKTIKKLSRSLTKRAKSDEEKARILYNFVSQNIRYVGMEFGINGYKPHKAGEVLRNRYGDCKDHATLLCAMLKAVGIKAYPVLIPTLGKANLDPSMPMPTAFNHEIAAAEIGKELLFLDSTSEVTTFGYLPSGDQGRRVLVVMDGKPLITKTPLFPPSRNVEGYRGKFILDKSGKLLGSMEFFFKGVYASRERYVLLTSTQDEIKRYVEKLPNQISPGLSVEDFKLSNYRNIDDETVKIDVNVKDEMYATKTENLMILRPPVPAYERLSDLVAQSRRIYDYVVGYRMKKVSRLKLEIPDGYSVFFIPEDFSYKNDVGAFNIVWKKKGRTLLMTSTLILSRAIIPKDRYGSLRKLFLTTVKTLRNQTIIIKRR